MAGGSRHRASVAAWRRIGRAFSPWPFIWPCTWGVAPGWYKGAPLALLCCESRVEKVPSGLLCDESVISPGCLESANGAPLYQHGVKPHVALHVAHEG